MGKKATGCGTILSLDESGGTTYTPVSNIANVTPPSPGERTQVSAPELDTCIDDPELGMKGPRTFAFTQYWEPGDTDHERLDTMYDANTMGGWQIEYPHGPYGVSQPKQTFNGKVQSIGNTQTGPNDTFQRDVVILVNGTITTVPGADA